MDRDRFDDVVKAWSDHPTRRTLLAFGALGFGTVLTGSHEAAARRKRKKRKKKGCKAGSKRCGGRCVPVNICCSDSECGPGGACVNGACFCIGGFKVCQGVCIAEATCCTNADCPAGSGKICQAGACACPAGQEDSGGVCGIRPDCEPFATECTPESAAACCSEICNEQFSACNPPAIGQPCQSNTECFLSGGEGECRGFICV